MDGTYGLDVAFATVLCLGLLGVLLVACAIEAVVKRRRRRWPSLVLLLFGGLQACDSPTAPPPAAQEVVGTWRGGYAPDGILRLSVAADLGAVLVDTCSDVATGRLCPQVRGRYEGPLRLVDGGEVLLVTPDGELRARTREDRMEGRWRGLHVTLVREP